MQVVQLLGEVFHQPAESEPDALWRLSAWAFGLKIAWTVSLTFLMVGPENSALLRVAKDAKKRSVSSSSHKGRPDENEEPASQELSGLCTVHMIRLFG
jgi:hypothetical protein